jgi:hypothetical protein
MRICLCDDRKSHYLYELTWFAKGWIGLGIDQPLWWLLLVYLETVTRLIIWLGLDLFIYPWIKSVYWKLLASRSTDALGYARCDLLCDDSYLENVTARLYWHVGRCGRATILNWVDLLMAMPQAASGVLARESVRVRLERHRLGARRWRAIETWLNE